MEEEDIIESEELLDEGVDNTVEIIADSAGNYEIIYGNVIMEENTQDSQISAGDIMIVTNGVDEDGEHVTEEEEEHDNVEDEGSAVEGDVVQETETDESMAPPESSNGDDGEGDKSDNFTMDNCDNEPAMITEESQNTIKDSNIVSNNLDSAALGPDSVHNQETSSMESMVNSIETSTPTSEATPDKETKEKASTCDQEEEENNVKLNKMTEEDSKKIDDDLEKNVKEVNEIVVDSPLLNENTNNKEEQITSKAEDNASTDDKSFDSVLEDEAFYPKTRRELKSILELSKEAKLEMNLSTRRKTFEKEKEKEKPTKDDKIDIATKKTKLRSFPVTAETEMENGSKRETPSPVKRSRKNEKSPENANKSLIIKELKRLKSDKDLFCWRCHHANVDVCCETCPRSYHEKCLRQTVADPEHWPCPECVATLKAENTETRSKAMKEMTLEQLCSLLKYAVKRMINCSGSGPFLTPVDEKQYPDYRNFIINPMDLSTLEKNIKNNLYGSTQAFETDAKWILHNSIIFNNCKKSYAKSTPNETLTQTVSDHGRLTSNAKILLRICKQEMSEIENCASCYLNANTKRKTWFTEICPKPHLLVWAKLKGFPYWPAKVMSITSAGMVDVRFFGAHDRSWVHIKDCLLYSNRDPNSTRQKQKEIMRCCRELDLYVENLKKIYGKVCLAPFKTPLEADYMAQLKLLIPNYSEKTSKEMYKQFESKVENPDEDNEEEGNSETESEHEDEEDSHMACDLSISSNEDSEKNGKGRPQLKMRIVRKRTLKRKRSGEDTSIEPLRKSRRKADDEKTNKENECTKAKSNDRTDDEGSPSKLKITNELIKKLEIFDKQKTEITGNNDVEINNPSLDNINSNVEKTEVSDILCKSNNEEIDISETVINSETNGTHLNEEEKENISSPDKKDENIDSSNKENNEQEKKDINEFNESAEKNEKSDNDTSEVIMDHDIKELVNREEDKNREKENNFDTTNDSSNIEEIHKKPSMPPKPRVNRKKKLENKEFTGFKLVPIQDILEKKDDDNVKNKAPQTDNSQSEKTSSSNSVTEPIVTIKVEQEDNLEKDDTQYMEAKRQYLSALNISEKSTVAPKNKTNEIRTRSKTEEKKSKKTEILMNKLNDITIEKASEKDKANSQKSDSEKGEIYIKPLSKMQATKPKARKSFPTPSYIKKAPATSTSRKFVINKVVSSAQTTVSSAPILMQVAKTTTINTTTSNSIKVVPQVSLLTPKLPTLTTEPGLLQTSTTLIATAPTILNNQVLYKNTTANNNAQGVFMNNETSIFPIDLNAAITDVQPHENELNQLNKILPESVKKNVKDIFMGTPQKPKQKPQGLLSTNMESGVPNSAGPVTTALNNVAQNFAIYFKNLLVETIEDIGKTNILSPEVTIANLRRQIEELNHKHLVELAEIKRNVSVVLKDIQKCVIEERERVINETKANCEMEMLQKIQETKAKQWCANCWKEAQLRCCWNTSYCDYPCQQKHWSTHKSKCEQNGNANNSSRVSNSPQSLLTTNSQNNAANSPKLTLFPKPQKVYVKKANSNVKTSSSTSHITLVESTPGNYEFLGNGPIAVNGKILATSNIIEKMKSGNITVTSPSRGSGCVNPSSDINKVAQKATLSVIPKNPNSDANT